jgi:hypothetical protein
VKINSSCIYTAVKNSTTTTTTTSTEASIISSSNNISSSNSSSRRSLGQYSSLADSDHGVSLVV